MEKSIVFVTSNMGKLASAQHHLKNFILEAYNHELIEPRTDDIQEIARHKVLQAFEKVGKPCIANDSGFFIDALNGFPRAFVNFALDTIGIEGILKLMEGEENRRCHFKECLAYYDGSNPIKYFFSEHPGNIAESIRGKDNPEKWSELWYIFISDYSPEKKTLAEYSHTETKERRNNYDSTFKKFAQWYEKVD